MAIKDDTAFRTIGEVSAELGIQQHILRYWETRFTQLRPLTRSGNRRYYRPDDIALVKRIHSLLEEQGYTIKGVQKLLSARGGAATEAPAAPAPAAAPAVAAPAPDYLGEIRVIRDLLAKALADDTAAALA